MPTSFRSSAGSSRPRSQQQQQEQSNTIFPSRTSTTTDLASDRAGSTGSSTRPELSSATRHRPAASSTNATAVHRTSTGATIDLTDTTSHASHSSTLSPHPRFGIASDDLHVATLNALGDWTGGILGLGDYFPSARFWDEHFDEEYDEEYEEDEEDPDLDLEEDDEDEEGEEDEEDEEEPDEEEDHDDFYDEDDDLLALAEEESLFLEDDFFLAGDEEGDSLLTHGFHHHHHALLDLLMGDELSSPSSYPSFIHGAPWPLGLDQSTRHSPSADTRSTRAAVQQNLTPLSPSRTTTQQTNLSNESVLITDEEAEEEEEDNTPHTSFSEDMPPTTRRGSHQSLRAEPPAKRRRTSAAHRPSSGTGNKLEPIKVDDDVFNDLTPRKTTDGALEELPTLDLTNATEVPQELQEPYQDNRIKLAGFQCVICMDDVTALTVTHCGHLYCAECLHSSIHTGATKGRCPMCRQKLEVKPRENYTTKTKGHWLLELKVKTSTRKGKRKAEA